MILQHVIEDMESVFSSHPESKDYSIALARYFDEASDEIEIRPISAISWDDEECFFIPEGAAKYYGLTETDYLAAQFLDEIKSTPAKISTYGVYAKVKTKELNNATVASLNSPLWATGFHQESKLLYFYYGEVR